MAPAAHGLAHGEHLALEGGTGLAHRQVQAQGPTLQARQLAPIGGEVADSTDFASWRNRTDVLLETLFPASGTTGAGVSRWLLPPAPAAP